MRDGADNAVIVCSIENVDPMGVHTGDSITVAPAQTLTDREYQAMRDAALACIRAIGVETGGSNVQFAVDPATGRHGPHRDEPARVAARRALASKATGFPIAKIAAMLAVGYRLDEIRNDITGETPGGVRADARLRRGEDPAVRVREVPRGRPGADDDDEVGGRGDGDRPDVHGGARQGAAGAGEGRRSDLGWRRSRTGDDAAATRSRSPRERRLRTASSAALAAGHTVDEVARPTRDRPLVRRPDRARSSSGARLAARATAATRPARASCARRSGTGSPTRGSPRLHGCRRRPTSGAAARRSGVRAGVQDRRHVRGRVRRAHAVPLLHLRGGDRGPRGATDRGW